MTRGYADVLVGLQFGDEGKAKIIDYLAPQYNIIARFNGGSNAGHTIIHDGMHLTLRQVPSGVHHAGCKLYIGSGCVVHLPKLVEEIETIEAVLGMPIRQRLVLSPHATVVQPHHILIDEYFSKEISTTKNGMGPAYADRSMRVARGLRRHIRLGDLLRYPELFEDIRGNLEFEMRQLGLNGLAPEAEVAKFAAAFEELKGLIASDALWLTQQVQGGAAVLFEGAQSVLLDVLHGTVPYVTGSHTVAANAFVGGDLAPRYLRKTIGVAKAVMSRVGHGPFPSEYPGYVESQPGVSNMREYEAKEYDSGLLLRSGDRVSLGRALRIIGSEYGSVTGRPRRIGVLDLVALRDAALRNGVDELYLTKCDILEHFMLTPQQTFEIVTRYDGDREASQKGRWCAEPEPVYEQRAAFDRCIVEPLGGTLNPLFAGFIAEVEEHVGVRIVGVGIGRGRADLVVRDEGELWQSAVGVGGRPHPCQAGT
ncbi:MAG: adenylosuccinate synthetase [Proteobacteria bacterium]|nr:adenylosuccinate synthetase [Pseudomonadota bacterium]